MVWEGGSANCGRKTHCGGREKPLTVEGKIVNCEGRERLRTVEGNVVEEGGGNYLLWKGEL